MPETQETQFVCPMCECSYSERTVRCPKCQLEVMVDARYRLAERLGHGGSGITWRAIRDSDGLEVCLKELRWERMGSLKDEQLFHREGAILRSLAHAKIPACYESFSWPLEPGPRHALWLVQEFVDGVTLESEARTRRYTEPDLLDILDEISEVLDYLAQHRPQLAHRDLKPANIMRRRDRSLVLVDFGAARAMGLAGRPGTTVVGTFGYMAPEQMRGDAGPASDVYGLGMTVLTLAAGASPEELLDELNRPDVGRVVGLSLGFRELLIDMLKAGVGARVAAGEVRRRIAAIRLNCGQERRPVAASSHQPTAVQGGLRRVVDWFAKEIVDASTRARRPEQQRDDLPSDHFYIRRGDALLGPFESSELLFHMKVHSVRVDTPMRFGEGRWQLAGEIPGVFSLRSWRVALVLSLLFGVFGVDRFYLGYKWAGTFKALTFGGGFFWAGIDFILLLSNAIRDAAGHSLRR